LYFLFACFSELILALELMERVLEAVGLHDLP